MRTAIVPSVNGKQEVKETPTSKPSANQVLINMHVSGICYHDIHTTHGVLGVNFPI